MTGSETRLRQYLLKRFPGAYVKKIPDFKQQGRGAQAGLPDYLLVYEGVTTWVEVKSSFGDTLSRRHFTRAQLIEFKRLVDAGAVIIIAAYTKSFGLRFVRFDIFLSRKSHKFTSSIE